MEDKSANVMYDFMKQFEPKNQKSLLGKIVNKIRKRDDKAKNKGIQIEEPMSDFDYWSCYYLQKIWIHSTFNCIAIHFTLTLE